MHHASIMQLPVRPGLDRIPPKCLASGKVEKSFSRLSNTQGRGRGDTDAWRREIDKGERERERERGRERER